MTTEEKTPNVDVVSSDTSSFCYDDDNLDFTGLRKILETFAPVRAKNFGLIESYLLKSIYHNTGPVLLVVDPEDSSKTLLLRSDENVRMLDGSIPDSAFWTKEECLAKLKDVIAKALGQMPDIPDNFSQFEYILLATSSIAARTVTYFKDDNDPPDPIQEAAAELASIWKVLYPSVIFVGIKASIENGRYKQKEYIIYSNPGSHQLNRNRH